MSNKVIDKLASFAYIAMGLNFLFKDYITGTTLKMTAILFILIGMNKLKEYYDTKEID